MKLLWGDGRTLEARDVGPVIVRFKAKTNGPPIKHHGFELLDDDAAREKLRAIQATGLYERERL